VSQENVDVVRGQFAAVNRRDFRAAADAFADDVVMAIHGDVARVAGAGGIGKRAVVRWFGDWFGQFEDDYRFEVTEARDEGDRVFVAATHHARGRFSGAEVSGNSTWLYEVRDGKIARIDAYDA
jgi:ketosteroid isomerase-like protein